MLTRASIRDVAERAGVSITTVSHALSGKGRLSPSTRERVRQVADELGYEPSVHARGLVTGESKLLAIQASGFDDETVIPQIAYILELVNAASQASIKRGYGLVIVPPGSTREDIMRLHADGAAVIDPFGTEPIIEGMRALNKPVVASGRVEGIPDIPFVDVDYRAGAFAVLDHLKEQGARRPALLTTGSGASYVNDVVKAYRSWCKENDFKSKVLRVRGQPTEVTGRKAIISALGKDEPPDAVFATLDTLAIGAMHGAQAEGMDVPGDFLVAALTDGDILKFAAPPITALDLHPRDIGEQMIDLLVNCQQGEVSTDNGQHRILTPTLSMRPSSTRH